MAIFIWRGWGFLVPVISFGCALAVNLASDAAFGASFWTANPWLAGVAQMLAAGLILWVSRSVDDQPRHVLDATTGQRLELVRRHDFFWIPMRWWALLIAGLGFGMATRLTG